jgi:3'-phosphoadenosine 5'-phosphosulfate sulfotransferase (PAPS reductase)/FAD synthetase
VPTHVVRKVNTDLDLSRLAMPALEVAHLTRPQRERRVEQLVAESHAILDYAVRAFVTHDTDDRPNRRHPRTVAAVVGLFSGGNDSTTMMYVLRDKLTHAGHANTGVGVEATRQYVRDTCTAWGLPLLERRAPREQDSYRAHVLEHGFPGPGAHRKMYQRLKLRSLEQMQRELVTYPHRERVVLVAGRRRTESQQRADVPEAERIRSAVWAAPLVNWTKLDLTTLRLMAGDVPRNEVSDLLHMSAECLCGSYAHPGEREELERWFPLDLAEIAELERLLAPRTDLPPWRKVWGWAGHPELLKASKARTPKRAAGPLCETCADPTGGETVAVVR